MNPYLSASVMEFSPLLHGLHQNDLRLAFHPDHWHDLNVKSGISSEMIRRAYLFSVRPCDLSRILGWNPEQVHSALAFPYPGTELIRLKVFPPFKDQEGRSVKYLQRKGTSPHIYLPPGIGPAISDPRCPLAIVEGEKKCLRAAQEGLASIGIGGIWCWKHKGQPLPDFDAVEWRKREVTIYPDGDAWTKVEIKRGTYELGQELKRRGASVDVAVLSGVTV